jgi:hypothetical protein
MSAIDKKTHIEEAISIWEGLFRYDFNVYKDIVKEVFVHHRIYTKKQLRAFWDLYAYSLGQDAISYSEDDAQWRFKQIRQSELTHIGCDGKYYDNATNEPVEILPDDLRNNLTLLLDALHLSDRVKEVITRPLLALRYCQYIFPDSSESNDNWLNDFNSFINDNGTRKIQLESIIQASLIYSENFNNASVALSSIAQNFFYETTKSLLNAEYLIMDNFSSLLDSVLQEETDESEEKKNGVVLPEFVKSFMKLAQYEKEMCLRIKKIIREEGNYRIAIDYHADEYVNNRFSSYCFVFKETSLIYENFVSSVIEMTMIDHLNKVNTRNIENLLLLWRRSDFVKKLSVNNIQLSIAVDMVRIKTASILISMLRQSNGTGSYKFYLSIGIKHLEDIMSELEESANKIQCEGNKFIKLRLSHKNNEIEYKEITFSSNWNSSKNDLSAYDSWTSKGREIYSSVSHVIAKVHSARKTIATITSEEITEVIGVIEAYQYDRDKKSDKGKTLPYYLKTIDFLDAVLEESQCEKSIEITKRVLQLLSTLLSESRKYVLDVENSLFPYYLPPFTFSFFHYDNATESAIFSEVQSKSVLSYDKKNFTNVFFYASVSSSLSNPFMFNRRLEPYSNKLSKWVYDFACRVDDESRSQLKSFKEEFTTSIDDQKKEIAKVSNRMENENLHTRNHTIQLVGLFAIFMAFITSAIGSIKVADNIWQYIIFSLTFLGGVTLFAILIKDFETRSLFSKYKSNESACKKEGKERFPTGWIIFVIIIVLLGIVYALNRYSVSKQEKDKTSSDIQSQESVNRTVDTNTTYVSEGRDTTS